MVVAEEVYRYPRRLTVTLELLSALGVFLALLWFGRNLLRLLWTVFGIDVVFLRVVPLLSSIVGLVNAGFPLPPNLENAVEHLAPPLLWLAATLLISLLVRNSLPTIRTSPRGILVEFAGDWLPVPWESLKAIKVTEDAEAKRYVLLAQTNRSQLTGWHRVYSFIYRLGLQPGFLITSAIGNFDQLIRVLLAESDRVARVLDNIKPAQLQEDASSPLFRFLLSPSSFFGPTKDAAAPAQAAPAAGQPIGGAYPSRIRRLVSWGPTVLIVLAGFTYLISWMKFLALMFPAFLLRMPLFGQLRLLQGQLEAPWWVLIAGHLALALLLGLALVIRNLLPELEARATGLAVRYSGRWRVVPWERVLTIKETTFSETSQIAFIQTKGHLPFVSRFAGLLYDGRFTPGVLVASAISNFDALFERIVPEVARHQAANASPLGAPIVQSDARSELLMLSLQGGPAIDSIVDESRRESGTGLNVAKLARAGRTMGLLALAPALLVFFDHSVAQGLLPDSRLVIAMVVLFVLGLLEWPLVCLGAQTFDEMTGGGEEGNRPFYLYPSVQRPRLLPLGGALVAAILGIPYLPVLLWLGGVFWSFLLAAGLWEALYEWRGTQLLAGGLVPVVFQLLIVLGYLLLLG